MTNTNKTASKILASIEKARGATSEGLLAQDLGLALDTVKRYVRSLIADGRIERGWDGVSLELTELEQTDRQQDRVMARCFKSLRT